MRSLFEKWQYETIKLLHSVDGLMRLSVDRQNC